MFPWSYGLVLALVVTFPCASVNSFSTSLPPRHAVWYSTLIIIRLSITERAIPLRFFRTTFHCHIIYGFVFVALAIPKKLNHLRQRCPFCLQLSHVTLERSLPSIFLPPFASEVPWVSFSSYSAVPPAI